MQFASFALDLTSPLHVGAGRAGMISRSRTFVPGHLFTYALAALVGAAKGGAQKDFRAALDDLLATTRFGPGFCLGEDGRLEGWDARANILLTGDNHVALDPATRSAVDGALYEIETLGHRHTDGRPVRIGAGVWFSSPTLAGRPIKEWLGALRLGGELKTGCGRTTFAAWHPNAIDYHGWGQCNGSGISLEAGDVLHGPTLDGAMANVAQAPLEPWLGRTYDYARGSFGTRLSCAALVRQHDRVGRASRWLPNRGQETGLGCWTEA